MGLSLHLPIGFHSDRIHDVDSDESQSYDGISSIEETDFQALFFQETSSNLAWVGRCHLCLLRRIINSFQSIWWRELPVTDVEMEVVPPRWLDLHLVPHRLQLGRLDLETDGTESEIVNVG